jgi:hypothetical protein
MQGPRLESLKLREHLASRNALARAPNQAHNVGDEPRHSDKRGGHTTGLRYRLTSGNYLGSRANKTAQEDKP